jgi:hypothetical protein
MHDQPRDYSGPYRHFVVYLNETDEGFQYTACAFEIYKGRKRFRRLYPPRRTAWGIKPISSGELERRLWEAVSHELGAQPPPGAPGGGGGEP